MEMGDGGLLERDHWMLEVNLGDMETTTGEQEKYWVVVISTGGGSTCRANDARSYCQRWALTFLTCVNPCTYRVGWLLVANLTKDLILEGKLPSLVVLTAALFVMKPLAYEDSYLVKNVEAVFQFTLFLKLYCIGSVFGRQAHG
jgi:hypothetical protein